MLVASVGVWPVQVQFTTIIGRTLVQTLDSHDVTKALNNFVYPREAVRGALSPSQPGFRTYVTEIDIGRVRE